MKVNLSRWPRKTTLLVAGLCVVVLAGAAVWYFNRGTTPVDAVPNGATNLCRNWDESEFESRQKKAQQDAKQDFPTHDSGSVGQLAFEVSLETSRCSATRHSSALDYFTTYFVHDTAAEGSLDPSSNDLAVVYEKYLTSEGLLSAWSVASRNTNAVPPPRNLSLKEIKEMQEKVGMGWAQASDTSLDDSLSSDYVESLRKLGNKKIQLRTYGRNRSDEMRDPQWELQAKGPVVYGWTVLAPLLRFGEYDEKFLTPVATSIVEFDREHDGDWTVKGEKSASFDMYDLKADDAMAAVLEALSRNKDAAKQVAETTGDNRVKALLD